MKRFGILLLVLSLGCALYTCRRPPKVQKFTTPAWWEEVSPVPVSLNQLEGKYVSFHGTGPVNGVVSSSNYAEAVKMEIRKGEMVWMDKTHIIQPLPGNRILQDWEGQHVRFDTLFIYRQTDDSLILTWKQANNYKNKYQDWDYGYYRWYFKKLK